LNNRHLCKLTRLLDCPEIWGLLLSALMVWLPRERPPLALPSSQTIAKLITHVRLCSRCYHNRARISKQHTKNPEDCQHWWVKSEIAAGNRRRALRPRPTLMIVRSFPRVAKIQKLATLSKTDSISRTERHHGGRSSSSRGRREDLVQK
jgi:hypothetical protein